MSSQAAVVNGSAHNASPKEDMNSAVTVNPVDTQVPPANEEINMFMTMLLGSEYDERKYELENTSELQNVNMHDKRKIDGLGDLDSSKRSKYFEAGKPSPEEEQEFNKIFGSAAADDALQQPGDDETSWQDQPLKKTGGNQQETIQHGISAITPPYSSQELSREGSISKMSSNEQHSPASGSPYPISAISTPTVSSPQAKGSTQAELPSTVTVDRAAILSQNLTDTKNLILKTNSLLTTYAALKSAYTQVCTINKTQSTQLAYYKQRMAETTRQVSTANNKARIANKKVEELMQIIKRLPDQGEILRKISVLEHDLSEKNAELEVLKSLQRTASASETQSPEDAAMHDQRLGEVLSEATQLTDIN
ncbi:uncharacterized protein V2V93DRAFT_367064 [Kockiozyma suomiensis]|uniref:uncharacterized protein n=1 Tax=Kockiozyma suomiensis TaxID=1337062 RepID=UPI003343B42D